MIIDSAPDSNDYCHGIAIVVGVNAFYSCMTFGGGSLRGVWAGDDWLKITSQRPGRAHSGARPLNGFAWDTNIFLIKASN